MKTEYIPLGRIGLLLARPEADRIAFFAGGGVFSDYKVVTFPNRKMLENCLKKGTGTAVVKNKVPKNCVIYRGLEIEE